MVSAEEGRHHRGTGIALGALDNSSAYRHYVHMGVLPTQVDTAVSRYLEALSSSLPPSPTGRHLETIRSGAFVRAQHGQLPAGMQRLADAGWCMDGVSNEDLAVLASRHWARTWVKGRDRVHLSTGKTVDVGDTRRPSVVSYKVAADWLDMTENAYRKRLTEARQKVVANMERKLAA